MAQTGSPTRPAAAIRPAAAVAADEVYHVVVTRLPTPLVGVGVVRCRVGDAGAEVLTGGGDM